MNFRTARVILGRAGLAFFLLHAGVVVWAATTVQIINFSFQPTPVNINVGDTVTWVQRDATIHTTTSDSNVWDSGSLSQNQTFSFTFKTAGNFPYHCSVHPFMTGSVNVAPAANQPPIIQITSPTNNQAFVSPATVMVSASASDPDGTVVKVEFFDGTMSVGTVASAPYSITLTNLALGSHQFTATATDDGGATTTSAAVAIEVTAPPPPLKITRIQDLGTSVKIQWQGGAPPYQLQTKTLVIDRDWSAALTTSDTQATIGKGGASAFYRIASQSGP